MQVALTVDRSFWVGGSVKSSMYGTRLSQTSHRSLSRCLANIWKGLKKFTHVEFFIFNYIVVGFEEYACIIVPEATPVLRSTLRCV